MSDTSNRIRLGEDTYFQLGFEKLVPNDGNAYALIRSDKNKSVAKLVKIEDGQQAAYVGTKPINVNGHDVQLMIDSQLLTVNQEGKLTVNLDEIGAELTDKLNIDVTNLSEEGKAAIIKLVEEAPETFTEQIIIKDKILTESGRTIALSSPDTNVVTYGDDDAYIYLVSKQDLIHMKNGNAVAIVDSENFQEYTGDLVASIGELDTKLDTKADKTELPATTNLLKGTAVNVATLATNAELATVVQKVNELIATLENRGVTKSLGQ